MAVLVGAAELDDVAVTREVVHDLHLPLHILDVIAVDELPRGDGLAGEALARSLVRDEVGDPELSPAELAAEGVGRAHVLHRASQNAAHGHLSRFRRRGRRRLGLRRGLGFGLGRRRRGRGRLVDGGAAVARGAVAHCVRMGLTKGDRGDRGLGV